MQGYIAQHGPRPWGQLTLVRYSVAVFSVVISLIVALWLGPVLDAETLLLVAVLMTAWVAGFWPAMVASLLATVAVDYYFTPPFHTLTPEIAHVPRLALFALLAAFFATASAARRRAEHSLKVARDEMEARVQERTAELRQTNEQLQAEIGERRRAEHALEELAGRLIRAQEEERSRIGRELHDHISQTLGVLTIKIDQLRANEEITPDIGRALDELRRDASDITDDVHRLSHRLHSSTLDYLGLVPALQKLVSEFSERHDISITFEHASLPSLPSEVALCLFRVAEESLTNIAKHSHARSATIHVTGAPDGIHLTVEDAGNGFDATRPESKAGLGFVSMQERLRVLHGTIRVDSVPSRGTRIDVWVPARIVLASGPSEADLGGKPTMASPRTVSSA